MLACLASFSQRKNYKYSFNLFTLLYSSYVPLPLSVLYAKYCVVRGLWSLTKLGTHSTQPTNTDTGYEQRWVTSFSSFEFREWDRVKCQWQVENSTKQNNKECKYWTNTHYAEYTGKLRVGLASSLVCCWRKRKYVKFEFDLVGSTCMAWHWPWPGRSRIDVAILRHYNV